MSNAIQVPVSNVSGEIIPAFAIMRVTGYNDFIGALEVDKPDTDGQTAVLVNGPNAIGSGALGLGCRSDPCVVAYDESDGIPANGESWGAASGSWLARKGQPGLNVLGLGIGGCANFAWATGATGGNAAETGIVLCKSNTPADTTGVGAECYAGQLLTASTTDLLNSFPATENVWMTVLGLGGPAVPQVSRFYGVFLKLGPVEATTGDSRDRVFVQESGGTGGTIPLVHVVAGEFYPDDPDDWYCRGVAYDTLGIPVELSPVVTYGRGLVDGDGTGWVYESTGKQPRKVDTAGGSVTHVIPIFWDSQPYDEDGPQYTIEFPAWGNTITVEETTAFTITQDPITCDITATPTLTSMDWTLAFDTTINLVLSRSPTPPPPPP